MSSAKHSVQSKLAHLTSVQGQTLGQTRQAMFRGRVWQRSRAVRGYNVVSTIEEACPLYSHAAESGRGVCALMDPLRMILPPL